MLEFPILGLKRRYHRRSYELPRAAAPTEVVKSDMSPDQHVNWTLPWVKCGRFDVGGKVLMMWMLHVSSSNRHALQLAHGLVVPGSSFWGSESRQQPFFSFGVALHMLQWAHVFDWGGFILCGRNFVSIGKAARKQEHQRTK